MPQNADKVRAALTSKGFQRSNSKDEMYHFFVDGKKTAVWTKISHGEKEIHDGLLATMSRRQLRLSRGQFDQLVECPLSRDAYLEILRKQGVVSRPEIAVQPPTAERVSGSR
ncbi:MAG: hypothetical protein KF838_04925 [Phycisphaeraceae bacterium]|nr:MAG: hypothetical protein KF838_04925 [Phycisphaeraceae bacterium]